jgi:carbon-monoxide dehydrogenase medium subunit/xanthine dehydrogenase FAD-binding subunit
MFKYDYLRPASVKEACELLALHGDSAKVIAGGTDLMVQIRDEDKKWANIKFVIDISHLKEMKYIKEDETIIRIGALSSHTDIVKSGILQKYVPFFCEASLTVGSPQIRNMGTIGGSIGNASPASDPVPPLIALDAEVKVVGISGERSVSLKSIFANSYKTTLKADEIITEVNFKKLPAEAKSVFLKLGRRKALAISRMNVGVVAVVDAKGAVSDIRIAPGCIFAVPDRVKIAEDVLLGKVPTRELLVEAGKKVSEEMINRTGIRPSTEFKKPAIESLTTRALSQALEVE